MFLTFAMTLIEVNGQNNQKEIKKADSNPIRSEVIHKYMYPDPKEESFSWPDNGNLNKPIALQAENTGNGQPIQIGLSIAVLSFGFLLTISLLYYLYKLKKGFGDVTFKTLGIILILTASLFLIVAGYNERQITPVIGLLGTIAGFIFGSTIKNQVNSSAREE